MWIRLKKKSGAHRYRERMVVRGREGVRWVKMGRRDRFLAVRSLQVCVQHGDSS